MPTAGKGTYRELLRQGEHLLRRRVHPAPCDDAATDAFLLLEKVSGLNRTNYPLKKDEHYPQAERVILGDYLDIGAHLTLTENDYVCIMTPGHQADREVLLQAMKTPACYVGCIGSRHKIKSTCAYLMENGIPEEDLTRIHAPIGLDILGQTPAEIAVSIAAEMILHRAKRSGTAKKPRGEG